MILPLLLQALPAPAQPPQQPPATMVVEPIAMAIVGWDADGDGRTSRAELTAGVRRSFAAVGGTETAPLGYLAFADWAERWLGDRNALPSPFEVDADGDGKVSLAELQAALARIFARLDRNNDGFVTRAEALTIRAQVNGPGEHRGSGKGHGGRRAARQCADNQQAIART